MIKLELAGRGPEDYLPRIPARPSPPPPFGRAWTSLLGGPPTPEQAPLLSGAFFRAGLGSPARFRGNPSHLRETHGCHTQSRLFRAAGSTHIGSVDVAARSPPPSAPPGKTPRAERFSSSLRTARCDHCHPPPPSAVVTPTLMILGFAPSSTALPSSRQGRFFFIICTKTDHFFTHA